MTRKLILLFLLISANFFSQTASLDACKTLSKIKELVDENHYRPKPINDSLSVYVFKTFLEKLDSDNSLFLESEVNLLSKHKLKIDNYIKENNCKFLDEFYNAYLKSVTRFNAITSSIKKENFPLNTKEIIQFYSKSRPYLKTEIELKKLYKKRMLMDVLIDISSISQNKDSLTKVFDNVALNSKEKIFKSYDCTGSNYLLTQSEFNQKFLSSFCSYFDPHTEYFNQDERTSFLSTISSDNLTFGMITSFENNTLTVQEIVPGSAAFYSGKIEKGDQIIKIKAPDGEITVGCSEREKLEKVFTSSDNKIVDFQLRKKNGEKYTVSLVKKVMKDYQNTVYSLILEKDNQKTGYIKIPSFYSKMENGKTNMSDDVLIEIMKLQDEKINGLIIDLEDNGGGSMQEAIKLCGFFISKPEVAIEKNRFAYETILNKETSKVYSGPLIILINGFSASASEFFTNAIQDYDLGIVLGTKSLGKATIQNIFPLDDENKEFVKLTLGQFYRVTGKTNQYIGITPNIEIPNIFQNQMPRENSFSTAIKNDYIKNYSGFKGFSMSEKDKNIVNKFAESIKSDTTIQKIKSLNTRIDKLFKSPFPSMMLNFNAVFEKLYSTTNLWNDIKKFTETTYPFNAINTKYDIPHINNDEYLQTVNKNNIKNIKNNFLVFQSVKLMMELIK